MARVDRQALLNFQQVQRIASLQSELTAKTAKLDSSGTYTGDVQGRQVRAPFLCLGVAAKWESLFGRFRVNREGTPQGALSELLVLSCLARRALPYLTLQPAGAFKGMNKRFAGVLLGTMNTGMTTALTLLRFRARWLRPRSTNVSPFP